MSPDGDIGLYLDRLTRTAREVRADNLIAVYTTGSLALHAFVTGRSDVDIVVLAEDCTSLTRGGLFADRIQHPTLVSGGGA